MTTTKLTEEQRKAAEEKAREDKILAAEKTRTVIERFKITEIGGWMTAPFLVSGIFLIILAIQFYSNKTFDWLCWAPNLFVITLMTFANEIKDEWELKLKLKHRIHEEDQNYKWIDYDYDCVYTDKKYEYLIYKIAKFVAYLTTIVIVGIIGFLFFSWIGTISIAPTTIIIFLLIIIILNQK